MFTLLSFKSAPTGPKAKINKTKVTLVDWCQRGFPSFITVNMFTIIDHCFLYESISSLTEINSYMVLESI